MPSLPQDQPYPRPSPGPPQAGQHPSDLYDAMQADMLRRRAAAGLLAPWEDPQIVLRGPRADGSA